ncbi:AARS [Cordylochernes scorpioides]|uniref:AARS n=1 Tax=Cordylochernes scorpioides TaxID=51811 RepID=A0ABY6LJF8_9ARAC|nr:AARS [Cordylochernes scorpioides]
MPRSSVGPTCLLLAVVRANVMVSCCAVQESVQKGLKANDWVKQISSIIEGKCGGKNDSATATGCKLENLDEAIKVATAFAQLKLGPSEVLV